MHHASAWDRTLAIFYVPNIPAVTPQTVELWDAKALKVATPEKLAWRRQRPGIEAAARPIKARKAMVECILDLKAERLDYI